MLCCKVLIEDEPKNLIAMHGLRSSGSGGIVILSFSDRMCMTDFTIVLGIDYSYSIMWCVYEIGALHTIISWKPFVGS